MITRDRPELTEQCIRSMRENAADWSRHRLVVVFDGTPKEAGELFYGSELDNREDVPVFIATGEQLGVGGAKNYGAAWFRGNARRTVESPALLMFSDNDMWYGPGWDAQLEAPFNRTTGHAPYGPTQLGGWRHPYHALGRALMWVGGVAVSGDDLGVPAKVYEVDAVTGNCFVIRWADWLKYGPFDSNAIGPGQSEDYALSQRIRAGGGLVATLDPPVAIHCGLVNSVGEPATGWRECEEQITEQLAGLSAEMRESVLIMRPAPTAESKTSWNSDVWDFGDPHAKVRHGRLGLDPARVDEVFEQARKGLDMQPREATADQGGTTLKDINERWNRDVVERIAQPRDPIVPTRKPNGIIPRREITIDEAMWMFPHPSRPALLGLNLCSGQRRFDSTKGWFNLDGQDIQPDRVPDLVWQANEPLPFSNASVMYVSIVHALEHFGCGESVPLLRECHRVLRPGGSLIIVVPDMRRLAARWLSGEISEYIFNVNCYGAYISDERDRHRWSISRESLPNLLGEAGTWSKITEFDYREIAGSDFPRDWWMLAMEAVK